MTSPGFLWRISRENRIVTAEGMEVTPHDGGGGFLSCRRRRAGRAGVPRRTSGRMRVGVSHTPRSPATRGGAGGRVRGGGAPRGGGGGGPWWMEGRLMSGRPGIPNRVRAMVETVAKQSDAGAAAGGRGLRKEGMDKNQVDAVRIEK